MQARGATICVFTAAVEKIMPGLQPTPKDLDSSIYGLLGQFHVLHTQNIKI
jgi:hypothetical protein